MDIGNQPIVPKKSSNAKKLFTLLSLLILLVVAVLLGYLYLTERESNRTLQAELNQTDKADNTSSPVIAPAQAKYSAEVGKFTLTLPSQRYITVDLDGGFEGGPATRLAVGTLSDKAEQTTLSPGHARVAVEAYPLLSWSYEDRKASVIDSVDAVKQDPVTIDGVPAESYRLNGLFTDQKLFFKNNDLMYIITAGNIDVEANGVQTMLDEVVKGFKFD